MLSASMVWMFVYWWCAFRFYMRLPHAMVMSILLNVIGLLVSGMIFLYSNVVFQ
jgi:hypothetical protein